MIVSADTLDALERLESQPREVRVGRRVRDLIEALSSVEDKDALVTVLVQGNSRDAFYLVSVEDCAHYTTGPRTFIKVD